MGLAVELGSLSCLFLFLKRSKCQVIAWLCFDFLSWESYATLLQPFDRTFASAESEDLEVCTLAVVPEHVQLHGGSFSSKYGT